MAQGASLMQPKMQPKGRWDSATESPERK